MLVEFVQDISANYGVAEQASPLITRVLCENPSPYTYTGTTTYLVGNRANLAVIDPGPMYPQHGEALLAAIGDKQLSHILVTHTHIDHSPLAGWLSEKTGAPTYAFSAHGAGRTGGLDGETVEAGADKDFRPDKLLTDGEIISGDGWTLSAHHTPGHTSNHMCFLLQEENTLFVGDHIMGWATSVISPPDGDMRAYLASLKKVAALGADHLVPAHGPWIDKPKPFIRGIITHRHMREGQILKLLEEKNLTIPALVARLYKGLDERLVGAAAQSVLGHMIALLDEERVECDSAILISGNYSLGKGQ
ncbi:MAG: MBL fold metallo-hydrolase [Kordiimonadaceae bacterium]|nr:MBL fold metallo-hydrolase [Kordiimonadaceae bacterium]